MKHAIAIFLIGLILWAIYGLSPKLSTKSIINFNTPFTISDISSIVSTVIAVVSLLVALWSVSIAVQQLKDARTGSEEQAIILKKQQESLDRSRSALEAANNTALKQRDILNNNLAVSIKQLDILNSQWKEQQEKLAKKPYFEIKYRFEYYVTSSEYKTETGITKISGGYILEKSDWLTESQIEANPYVLKLSNTLQWPEEYDGNRSFKLEVSISNIGSAIANNMHVILTPLVYGIIMKGDSVRASGAMVDRNRNPIYSPADVHRNQLSIFQDTQEQFLIPFEVIFLRQELGHIIPIRIDMYSDNIPMRTVQLKFMISKD